MAISSIPRSVGHNFLPEYQISGIPFMRTFQVSSLTDEGGEVRSFEFPKITQWLSFKTAEGVSVKVCFCKEDADDVQSNFIDINAETSYPMRIRCTKLYFNKDDDAKTIEVRAGLTVIEKEEFSNVVETFLEKEND